MHRCRYLARNNIPANYPSCLILGKSRLSHHTKVTEAANSDPDVDPPLLNPNAVLDYVRYQRPNEMPDCRLLRNLSVDLGLVKNTRVVVVGTGSKSITVRMLQSIQVLGININSGDILLPRITFKQRLSSGHTICRRQFPLAPPYASTFDSCQGLTGDR